MTMTYKRRPLLCGCAGCDPAAGFASTAVNRRSFLAGGAAIGAAVAAALVSGVLEHYAFRIALERYSWDYLLSEGL